MNFTNSHEYFVFFVGDDTDFKYIYRDLQNINNVTLIQKDRVFDIYLLDKFFKFCFSQKVNSFINIPFKALWFNSIMKKACSMDYTKNYTFVFQSGWYNSEFVVWIKKNYPNIRLAIFFNDTISCYSKAIKNLNPELLLREFDTVFCYNPDDVAKYGFTYLPAYFSRIPDSEIPNKNEWYDIVFIGNAKDRLDLIRSIKKGLDLRNIRSCFIVGGVSKNEKKNDGIRYIDKNISYIEYLSYIKHSECILELIKGDTSGSTLRCWEAVYYNKKLITNWSGIIDFSFYDSSVMKYFYDIDSFPYEFLKKRMNIKYNYNKENSPLQYLKKLESLKEVYHD